MIIVDDIEQGTDEWHALRVGNPGASGMDKIITSTGKKSTQRQKYLYQLAGEIMAGVKGESFTTEWMTRGKELEADAREMFEFTRGAVEQCALIYQDERRLWHCSPDAIVPEKETGVEFKCPSLPVHVEYLDKRQLPTAYKIQVQSSMMVTRWAHWYFVSYYPGIKPFILLVERDENLIALINEAVEEFCADLQNLVERLQ